MFLQTQQEKGDIPPGLFLYPEHVLEHVGELSRDALFVGVSLMTNYFDRVIQLCDFIREKVGKPVVLGGIHPTLMPRECAEHAEYVCIGEGEGAVVDIARAIAGGNDASSLGNVCCFRDGEFIRNAPRPLVENLDEIPFPDYSLDDDYVLVDDELKKLDLRLLENLMQAAPGEKVADRKPYYITMMTRGCRYACTYCCNRSLLQMYGGHRFVRRRSVANVIEELCWVREHLPFVEVMVLSDDSFFDTDVSDIREFCEAYKSKIGLPFFSLGTPFGIDDEKLRLTVDAGMVYVQMGIQTGSERIRKMYKRPFSNDEIKKITDMLATYVPKILPPRYDIIIDNPMEEDQDVIATIRLLLRIRRPYLIQFFCLTLFPGTELGDRAVKRGIITDWRAQVYRKQLFHKKRTYLNLVLALFNTALPRSVIRLMIARPALFLFNRPYFGKLLRLVLRD